MTRAGVVGVGSIGRQHARIYSELEDVELIAVADPVQERREAIASRLKIRSYSDSSALFEQEQLDVVSIAVPTEFHASVSMAALDHGIHVLVEKPIAANRAEAKKMIERSVEAGRILCVGHVERYNPAVIELKRRLSLGELGQVFQVHSRRLSPFPQYVRDVGVVMDLATHELDILPYLLEKDPESLFARTSRWLAERHEDAVFAILSFPGGVDALLEINWLTPTKVRELRVTGQRGMFVVDYLSQDLLFYENSFRPAEWDTLALFRGMEEGNVTKIRLSKIEPLRAEIASFVEAVRKGTPPLVSGADGLQALVLAELLIESGKTHRPLQVAGEMAGIYSHERALGSLGL